MKIKKFNDKIEIENQRLILLLWDKIKVNDKLIKDGDYMISPFSKDKDRCQKCTYVHISDN